MKNRYEIDFYSFYDISGMQEHLEKMASKGWFLDKITNYYWHYHKGEPKQLRYSISYYAKASNFESEPSDGQLTFQEYCEYAGWKLVAYNAKLQVFANENENPTPIHTELKYEIEEIKRLAKQFFIPNLYVIVVAIVDCYFTLNMIKHDPIGLFVSPIFPGLTIAIMLMALYLGMDFILYLKWLKKAEIAAENNEFVNTHHKFHSLFGIVSWMSLIISLVSIILSSNPLAMSFAIYCIGLMLIVFVVVKILDHFKRKKYSTNKNRLLTFIVIIVLCFILTALTSSSVFVNLGQYNNEVLDEKILQISDFKEIDNAKYVHDLKKDTSVFLSRQSFAQHASDYLDYSLNYTIIDIKTEFIKPLIIDQLLHEYDEYDDHKEDYDSNHPFYTYESIEAKSWDVDEAYQFTRYGEPDEDYILVDDNKIIKLSCNWPITQEDKTIIIKKLVK